MRLRTKLTLGIVAATFAMFVVAALVVIPASKAALRDRVDARLVADLASVRNQAVGADGRLRIETRRAAAVLGDRRYAVSLRERSGATRRIAVSGPATDPDPRPVFENIATADLPSGDEVAYVTAADGFLYRYATIDLGDGRRLLVAAPVQDVTEFVNRLIGIFWLVAAVAALVLGVMSWLWIRRGLRPVERLIQRADAIAGGDADRRIDVDSHTPELDQLAKALQEMIASLDASMARQAESEARLRQFIADASHELRTPLTTIAGYLQLDASGALEDPAEHDRAIRRALAETGRLSSIVADLQLLTGHDAEEPVVGEVVDLRAIAEDALTDATALDAARRYDLRPGEPVTVMGDPARLRQIVANLLANVRTHTPAGTTARVGVAARGERAVLEVADDGPGVPADGLPHVFDRFWRRDASRSRATGGSGLGLAIVASLAERHGGTATAHEAPDGGLVVTVALPLAADVPEPARPVSLPRGAG